ncbi:MAG: entericidin A/B family lipoprotein [Pseudomonadota bacterium]
MVRVKQAVVAMIALAILAGCNTIEGAGRDIQSAGETVEDAAD